MQLKRERKITAQETEQMMQIAHHLSQFVFFHSPPPYL